MSGSGSPSRVDGRTWGIRFGGARLLALAMTCGLLTFVGAAANAQASSAPGPASSFDVYSGSTPLSSFAPGAILNSRTVSFHLSGISLPITVIQLLYRSTGAMGQATATVTSILEPPVPAGSPKVVSYQSFYDSLNPADEPSQQFAGANTSGGEAVTAEDAIIAPLLTAGITVVVPDTEGETADFAAGPEYGMNTLDSFRAVFNDAASDGVPATAPAAMMGYSGGAIATDWAAQLAPSYAPDVNKRLVGAAEGGILADPAHNLDYVGGSTVWAGVIPMAIIGVARSYDIDLEQYMNSYGKSVYDAMQSDSIASVLGEYPGLTWQKIVLAQYDNPDSVEPFVTAVNKLDMGTAPMPTIPMFMGQGTGGQLEGTAATSGFGPGDGVMIAGDVRTLAREFCDSGDTVHYEQYATSHFTSAPAWIADAEPWVINRLNGESDAGNCSSIASGNSLAPQVYTGTAPAGSTSGATTPASTTASARFSAHQTGAVVNLTGQLPAGASRFSFHWQTGVTFGAERSKAAIARQLALYSEPANRRAAIRITALSGPRGRVQFALTKGTVTRFSFRLRPTALWFSRALRARIEAHRLTRISGTLQVRAANDHTYSKTLSFRI